MTAEPGSVIGPFGGGYTGKWVRVFLRKQTLDAIEKKRGSKTLHKWLAEVIERETERDP